MAWSFVASRSRKRANSPPAGWLRGDRKFEAEFHRLLQSWQFPAYRREAAALALVRDSLRLRTWSIWNIRRATRLPARRDGAHHVHPRPRRLDSDACLHVHGGVCARILSVASPICRCNTEGGCAAWRSFHLHLPRNRLLLGQTY